MATPTALGEVQTLIADNGFFSQANVIACNAVGVEPLLAFKRQTHYEALLQRFAPDASAP